MACSGNGTEGSTEKEREHAWTYWSGEGAGGQYFLGKFRGVHLFPSIIAKPYLVSSTPRRRRDLRSMGRLLLRRMTI